MSGVKAQKRAWSTSSSPRNNFYHKLVHRLLLPLRQGSLTMHLPDGSSVVYGGQSKDIEAVIYVHRWDFFRRCVLYGDIGFGESYVAGDWDTEDITKLICWMILNIEGHPTLMADRVKRKPINFFKLINQFHHFLNRNTISGSRENIKSHYDLSNDFFKLFLDPTMAYSSAYFKSTAQTLQEAQEAKYEELCRKLRLKSTDHVLEIGCGWGGFAIYAARNFGCTLTAITISQQQYQWFQSRIQEENLSKKIDVQMLDYRKVRGQYDKIVSIEMIEAVGDQFLETYFRQCHELLKPNGLLGLQMILAPDHRYRSFKDNVDWIQKHIFPGSLLPSMKAVMRAVNRTGTLGLYDFEDISPSYAKTLAMWRDKFNQQLTEVRSMGFDEDFIRKWNYYFSYCEAAFKMRNISVAQVIFSRPNNILLAFPLPNSLW